MRNFFDRMLYMFSALALCSGAFCQDFVPVFDVGSGQISDESVNVELILQEHATVASPTVKFPDIGKCSGSASFCAEVASIHFSRNLRAGERLVLQKNEIERILKIEFPQQEFNVTGPERIVVQGEYTVLQNEEIERFLQNAVEEKIGDRPDIRLRAVRVMNYSLHKFFPGDITFQAKRITDAEVLDSLVILLNGRKMIDIEAKSSAESQLSSFGVSTHMDFEVLLPTSKVAMTQGKVVTSNDFVKQWHTLTSSVATAVRDLEQINGMRLKSPLRAGQFVSPTALNRPILVRHGDLVKVVLKRDEIDLVSEAKAMASGGIGDVIRVLNIAAKKSYNAKIIGDDQVEVVQ